MWPWPRAFTTVNGQVVQVQRSCVVGGLTEGMPGELAVIDGEVIVSCGEGLLQLETVQPAGGKAMSGTAWLSGYRGSDMRFETNLDEIPARPLVEPAE